MRLGIGIALSLLGHALLLSLQFGVLGLGLPGLQLPWSERRGQASALNVRLADAKRVAQAPPPTAQAGPAQASPTPQAPPAEASPPTNDARMQVQMRPRPPLQPAADAATSRPKATVPKQVARGKPQRAKRPSEVIALSAPKRDAFVVPAPALDEIERREEPPAAPAAEPEAMPVEELVAQEQEPAAQKPNEEQVKQLREATRAREETEARRTEEERQARQLAEESTRLAQEREAKRLEQEQQQAMELEARRQAEQAALALQKQIEETRLRDEALARRNALELQARQQAEETARRQEAALMLQKQLQQREQEEAARRAQLEQQKREEARRQEEAQAKHDLLERHAREQAEAAMQRRAQERLAAENAAAAARAAPSDMPASGASLPKNLSGDLAGRALDLVRRPSPLHIEPSQPAPPVADAADPARRHSIFGGADVDVGLRMYIESWRLKIERNGRLNYSQTARDKARGDPIVTVSIRSDGSVEQVVINRPSGHPAIDEAVRRIVKLNERYSAFPPNLARKYDVIEIRRVWNFDDILRILEEVR